MVDCPSCDCNDSAEVVAAKKQAADLKAKILARQSELLGTIESLRTTLAALQAKNTEYLRPKAEYCSTGTMTPQSLNAIKTYRFGKKCGDT